MTAAATHTTQNDAWTHPTSQDARVDLFAQLLPTTQRDTAVRLFEAAWAQHPEHTLKLIFHAGMVRKEKEGEEEGKKEKKGEEEREGERNFTE
jgi:hypothetical protein